jgi:nickel-dependent lactate racemase
MEEKVRLPIGTGHVEIPLPPGSFDRLTLPLKGPGGLTPGAIKSTLLNPIHSRGLENLAGSESEVVISVPDSTRVAGADLYVGPLVEILEENGVREENITFIFALGLHRPLGEMEKMRILGSECCERFTCLNHNPVDPELVALGETSRGTRVAVHPRAAEADLVITTGSVVFHFHAGFGGGPKGIVPGLAGEETIRHNHLLALRGPEGWHPACRPGNTEGNPIYEDLVEAARMLEPPIFLANSLLDPEGVMFDFVAGDLEKAHEIGRERYRTRFGIPLIEPVDVAVLSAGGRPRDLNLIQAHKAVAHTAPVVREGGTIVLAAECIEGFGHPDFAEWLRLGSPARILAETETSKKKYAQTAFAFLDKCEKTEVLFVTAMDVDDVALTGGRKVEPGEIAPYLREKHGDDPSGIVLTEGATLLPYLPS